LESVANQIMYRTVMAATGLTIPTQLVWYLFRGRYVFQGDREESRRALDFVLKAYRAFLRRNDVGMESAAVGAAVLDDASNVLRCGGWSPMQCVKAFTSIVPCAGARTLLSSAGLRGAMKLLLIPLGRARRYATGWNIKNKSK